MPEETSYSLRFLVDSSKISKDELVQKVESILAKHLSQIDLKVSKIDSKRLELFINGSLNDIDACHQKLNKSEEYDNEISIRLRDDAGEKIRRDAYPIVAQIELQLRKFINCAMNEVFGFDWWDSMAPQNVKKRVMDIEERNKKALNFHDKIEFTEFDHLIEIVIHSFQAWSEDRQISVSDLNDIISDCGSFEDIKCKFDNKLNKISLWDDVFSKYFNNINDWDNLKSSLLKDGIPLRNKVMHHRPIYLFELEKLKELKKQVDVVLSSAKVELEDKNRIEASQIGNSIIGIIKAKQDLASMMESIMNVQQDFASKMEPIMNVQQDFASTMEPIIKAKQDFASTMESIMKVQQDFASMMEPNIKVQPKRAKCIAPHSKSQ
jgi:CRISPR/Cas system-associated endonuclease Cas3-HD